MSELRANRVGEEIKREVTQLLRDEMKDPRIGFVTVTSVEVSHDLRYARIYVSVMGSAEETQQTMIALNNAKGFVRTEISRKIRLRVSPEIEFRFDESIKHGARIMKLLGEVKGAEDTDE